MDRKKIYINLYQSDQQSITEESLWPKMVERFLYVFKFLAKTSGNLDAHFSSNTISLNGVKLLNGKSDIGLYLLSSAGENDMNAVCEIESLIGKERVFILSFGPESYSRAKGEISGNLFPLFHTKPDGNTVTFFDFLEEGRGVEDVLFLKVLDLIDTLQEANSRIAKPKPGEQAVYLALTDEKLKEERNILKRELKRMGYKVNPEADKIDTEKYYQQLKDAMEKCNFSIHLINPADISGLSASLSSQQNQLAFQRYQSSPDFSRILWMAGSENENEWEAIERLGEKAEELEGAEVVQNSIETLKSLVKHKLRQPKRVEFASLDQETFKVYFIYDKFDEKSALEVMSKTSTTEREMLKPLFKGGFYQIRNHHIHCLKEADIVVVFGEKVNSTWLQMKYLEILKSPGMGRTKKWQEQIFFLNAKRKMDWLTDFNEGIRVLDGDAVELREIIETGRKMLVS